MNYLKIIKCFFIAYILILFIAGLWPFTFNPKNNVHWIENKPGIYIKKDSIIYSEQLSPRLYKKLISANGFSIETILRPDETFTHGLRFILACGAVGRQYNFALGQRRDGLLFFLKTMEPPGGENIHTIEIKNIFAAPCRKHLVITCDNGMTKLFVDGSLVKHVEIPGTFSNWDKNARIFVGNDDSGEHSWEGDIYKIAIYERAMGLEIFSSEKIKSNEIKSLLYYDFEVLAPKDVIKDHGGQNFEQDLFIPKYFNVLGKTILSLPNRYFLLSTAFLKDVFINVSGFIPLGVIIFLWIMFSGGSTRCAFCSSIMLGFTISVSLEVIQIFLPLRSSSCVDLFNNILGSFIGAYLCRELLKKGYLRGVLFKSNQILTSKGNL